MNNLSTSLTWRYATKKFDSSRSVSSTDLVELIESVRLAPTSFGLPVFRIIRVTDKALRNSIQSTAYGQPQVTDASDLLIFVTDRLLTVEKIDKYLAQISQERSVPIDSLSKFREMLVAQTQRSESDQTTWIQKQAYIGLGFLLLSAAIKEIDTCPMEGFDPTAVGKLLNLSDSEVVTLICPVGYRDASDSSANYAKVRTSSAEFLQTI